jgi:Fe2+ transport system protein FeoA
MSRKEQGHIETMSCGRGCINALTRLGIRENTDIVFIRPLPHMDYITVIDGRERTRLSEGEAARIWGKCKGIAETEKTEETQFYFARRRKIFSVTEIIGGKTIGEYLKTHGVQPGSTLMLEKIEQTQELHKAGVKPVTITSGAGLRLHLDQAQAKQIIVKQIVRDSDDHPGQHNNK